VIELVVVVAVVVVVVAVVVAVVVVVVVVVCMHALSRRVVLVGNSGIGKSYMQLLILLWWARKELRPQGRAVIWDEFLDGVNLIARVEVGRQTDLFIKNDRKHYYSSPHLPNLRKLDSDKSLLLYEPSLSTIEIIDCCMNNALQRILEKRIQYN
jgi:hypothetical protein